MRHKIIHFFSLIIIVIFITSCGNNNSHSKHTHDISKVLDHHSHQEPKHSQKAQISGMELNNGKKWKMDEHTRSIFKKMQSSFKASNHITVTDLQSLGTKLKDQLNDLIKGCTMTGGAHNQLHIFLTEYIPTIERLVASNDLESSKDEAMKIKKFLDIYDNYFE